MSTATGPLEERCDDIEAPSDPSQPPQQELGAAKSNSKAVRLPAEAWRPDAQQKQPTAFSVVDILSPNKFRGVPIFSRKPDTAVSRNRPGSERQSDPGFAPSETRKRQHSGSPQLKNSTEEDNIRRKCSQRTFPQMRNSVEILTYTISMITVN